MFVKSLARAIILSTLFFGLCNTMFADEGHLRANEMAAELMIPKFYPNGDYEAPGHHENHAWYQKMQAELGVSCCDERSRDCGPVTKFEDLGLNGVRVVLEDGEWHKIPHSKNIFYVDTPDGRAHVCRRPIMYEDVNLPTGSFSFYCVFLPRPSF